MFKKINLSLIRHALRTTINDVHNLVSFSLHSVRQRLMTNGESCEANLKHPLGALNYVVVNVGSNSRAQAINGLLSRAGVQSMVIAAVYFDHFVKSNNLKPGQHPNHRFIFVVGFYHQAIRYIEWGAASGLDIYDTACGLATFRVGFLAKMLERSVASRFRVLICRDLRANYYRQSLRRSGTIRVFFPDVDFATEPKATAPRLRRGVAVVGWIGLAGEEENISDLVEALCEDGIRVGIYSQTLWGRVNDRDAALYYRILENYPTTLSIYEKLDKVKLTSELYSYRYGLMPHSADFRPIFINERYSRYDRKYLPRAGGSRLADYISSDVIPVVSRRQWLQYRIAKRYSAKWLGLDEDVVGNIKTDFYQTNHLSTRNIEQLRKDVDLQSDRLTKLLN